MLSRIRKAQENEGGFTLIELLVVMIIIGVLAAIAIPAFLGQKRKAAESSAKSDATNIARDAAAFLVDGAPTTLTLTGGDNSTSSTTKDATLSNGTAAENTTVKIGARNNATMTYASGVFCVIVDPAESGAATWSANTTGLFKSNNCA